MICCVSSQPSPCPFSQIRQMSSLQLNSPMSPSTKKSSLGPISPIRRCSIRETSKAMQCEPDTVRQDCGKTVGFHSKVSWLRWFLACGKTEHRGRECMVK